MTGFFSHCSWFESALLAPRGHTEGTPNRADGQGRNRCFPAPIAGADEELDLVASFDGFGRRVVVEILEELIVDVHARASAGFERRGLVNPAHGDRVRGHGFTWVWLGVHDVGEAKRVRIGVGCGAGGQERRGRFGRADLGAAGGLRSASHEANGQGENQRGVFKGHARSVIEDFFQTPENSEDAVADSAKLEQKKGVCWLEGMQLTNNAYRDIFLFISACKGAFLLPLFYWLLELHALGFSVGATCSIITRCNSPWPLENAATFCRVVRAMFSSASRVKKA